MRIGIESTELYHPLRSGIHRARMGLVDGLLSALPRRHRMFLFSAGEFHGPPLRFRGGRCDQHRVFPMTKLLDKVFKVRSPCPPRPDGLQRTVFQRAWNRAVFDLTRRGNRGYEAVKGWAHSNLGPERIKKLLDQRHPVFRRADVFLWSTLYYFCVPGAKNFYFLHDLTPVLFPQYHQPETVVSFRRTAAYLSKTRFYLVTNSEHTRQDAIRVLRWDPDRVWAVHLGVGEEHRRLEGRGRARAEARRTRLGIPPGRFLLTVATFEPRKNLQNVVRAYRLLMEDGRRSPLHLVLAGDVEQGWKNDEVLRMIRERRGESRIICTGHLSPRNLAALYNLADVFLFPSYHEGFGLPLVEAMACGAPVIVSDRAALPEIAGEAAIQVDPDHPEEIAAAAARLLDDPALREKMRAQGFERAARFTWKKAGERLLSIFEDVATSQGGAAANGPGGGAAL